MSSTCDVASCDRTTKGRGLCEAHLLRLRKTGSVASDVRIAGRNQPLAERLLSHVDRTTLPGCLLWTGSLLPDGYGQTVVGSRKDCSRRSRYVHLLAYEEFVGPIPVGYQIDHVCHGADPTCMAGNACLHRRCLAPAHLEAVTPLENSRRSRASEAAAQRAKARETCRRGHPYDATNTRWYRGNRWCRACDRIRAAKSRANGASPRTRATPPDGEHHPGATTR